MSPSLKPIISTSPYGTIIPPRLNCRLTLAHRTALKSTSQIRFSWRVRNRSILTLCFERIMFAALAQLARLLPSLKLFHRGRLSRSASSFWTNQTSSLAPRSCDGHSGGAAIIRNGRTTPICNMPGTSTIATIVDADKESISTHAPRGRSPPRSQQLHLLKRRRDNAPTTQGCFFHCQ